MRAAAFSLLTILAFASVASAEVKHTYFPEYAGPDGGIVEFKKDGFYITYFDDQGDYSYDCKKLESLTTSIHWAQCVGGDKFLFTLDPKHPETMKIGDVVYKACGQQWQNCK